MNSILNRVESIAEEAGRRILEYYDSDPGVTYKEDHSPLTLADQASHDYIESALKAAYPDIPVVSEEGVVPPYEERKHYERFWLVDPLDGTKEFIKKNGEFTVNIALIEGERPVMGVVGLPARGWLYAAKRGEGARVTRADGEAVRLRVNHSVDLQKLTASVSRSHPSGALDRFLRAFPGLERKELGSSLKFCFLAEGRVDFYPRFGPLNEWDTAAAHLVAEESGVVTLSLQGEPLRYNQPVMKSRGFIAAATHELLKHLLDRYQNGRF